MRTLFSALVVGLLVASCGATSGTKADSLGRPARISLRDYRSGFSLALVNESHTDRVQQYSEVRADAATKVQTDEVVDELLSILEREGFERLARAGAALPDGQATKMIEVEDASGLRHALRRPGMSPEDAAAFEKCVVAILGVYDATFGLQAIDGTNFEFRTPERSGQD